MVEAALASYAKRKKHQDSQKAAQQAASVSANVMPVVARPDNITALWLMCRHKGILFRI